LGLGVVLLPVSYVGLMYLTQQPIEWPVLALMALIVLPILVFRKSIGAVEQQVDAMTDAEKAQAAAKVAAKLVRRSVGSD
jgi:hypothetical protein